jgi:hypothetical protein
MTCSDLPFNGERPLVYYLSYFCNFYEFAPLEYVPRSLDIHRKKGYNYFYLMYTRDNKHDLK